MILWTLLSLAAASLWILPKPMANLEDPVFMKWWLDYLVPLDELQVLHRGDGGIYIRLFDTKKEHWVYINHETLKTFDDTHEPTIILHAPCRNDLGFKALRSLLVGPIFCEIFLNGQKFRARHIELIPPEILKGLSSNELLALIGPLTIVELINHYVDVGLVHVLWKKLFDKHGRCLVIDWHHRSLLPSRCLGLEHLTLATMLNGWDMIVPKFNLITVLASLTSSMLELFIEYTARIFHKETSEVRKWHPLMLLIEMGLIFDEYVGLTLEDLRLVASHFCDREILDYTLMQRIVLFLEKTLDPRYHQVIVSMIHHYWTNMVAIDYLSERIINEYIASRRIMGNVPFVAALDPLFIHMSNMYETEFSVEIYNALLRLWPWEEFRKLVLASLVEADHLSLTFSDPQFQGIERFDNFFSRPEFFQYLSFATLRWLESNVDYALPEQFLFNLCVRVRGLAEWIEERTMIHLILIHQSQFFKDGPMRIPDHVCQTILADIMLKVDPYYVRLIPNIMGQLSISTNPFVYFRRWTNLELCTPPIEFIVKYMCPENIMDESGPPLVEFRSEYLDLDHRVIMAAFNRKRNEFSSAAQIMRFQWWLSQRTFYHGELFSMILQLLKEKFPESLSINIIMESYCDYFMVPERNWTAVWSHALTLGDGIIPINLLTILNLRKEQDISGAIHEQIFHSIDGSEVVVFSLDIQEMHPHLIELIAGGNYFNDPENACEWSKSDGSNLLPALLKDDAVDQAYYLSKPNIFQIDRKGVARALGIHPEIVDQMIELRQYSTNCKFYQDVLPRYPGLPISYLAQVFKDLDEDVTKTRAYLDKNTT